MIRRLAAAATVLLALAAPASAEGSAEPAADARFVSQCLDVHLPRGAAAAERRCVGLLSVSCMNRPEGATTVGQSACLIREAAAWESVMRAQLAALSDRVARHDAVIEPAGAAAPALAEAQAAWADYAEAECRYAHALWGQGSFRQVAGADCRLNTAARRAIQLRAQIGFEN
ncbi:MAG: lysozyme inhibitor LprI family protein [Paracoccaceae bacterium]